MVHITTSEKNMLIRETKNRSKMTQKHNNRLVEKSIYMLQEGWSTLKNSVLTRRGHQLVGMDRRKRKKDRTSSKDYRMAKACSSPAHMKISIDSMVIK